MVARYSFDSFCRVYEAERTARVNGTRGLPFVYSVCYTDGSKDRLMKAGIYVSKNGQKIAFPFEDL